MRAIVPVVAVLVGLMMVAGVVLLAGSVGPALGEWVGSAIDRHRTQRRVRAETATPWTHYCRSDPQTGEYAIGIERVCVGRVLESTVMARVPEDDVASRLDWEGRAIARAAATMRG